MSAFKDFRETTPEGQENSDYLALIQSKLSASVLI